MAKPGRNEPCPCGSGKKFKNCHLGREQELAAQMVVAPSALPAVPDLLEELTWDDDEPLSELDALEEAWAMVAEIEYLVDPEQQLALAREALSLSPDCAGPYYYLAIHEPDPELALQHIDDGLTIAARVIAPELLDDLASRDWLLGGGRLESAAAL